MKTRLIFFFTLALVFCPPLCAYEITSEIITNICTLETGMLHMHGRQVFNGNVPNEKYKNAVSLYAKNNNVTEEDFSSALIDYVEQKIRTAKFEDDVSKAMRFVGQLNETNSLPRLITLAADNHPPKIMLPLVSAISNKSDDGLVYLCLPHVKQFDTFDRMCFYQGVLDKLDQQEMHRSKTYINNLKEFISSVLLWETDEQNLTILSLIEGKLPRVATESSKEGQRAQLALHSSLTNSAQTVGTVVDGAPVAGKDDEPDDAGQKYGRGWIAIAGGAVAVLVIAGLVVHGRRGGK